MSDIPNITSVVNSATELLDDIRGGAITRMKAQHDESMQQFGTERQGALSSFADEKSQSLNEFNSQKSAALNSFDQQGKVKIAEVDNSLSQYVDAQSHVRLTKNQALRANDAGTFPVSWASGYVTRAERIERVSTGIEPSERSPLAQEFLSAINSNGKYFAGSFDIWELEIEPHRHDGTTYSYAMYQHFRKSCAVTAAAIVKHISGVVPDGFWCHGLRANEPAKVCGRTFHVGTNRNSYSNCHPYVRGVGQDEKTIIQVALPAVVTGEVDISKGAWGQFPYIGEQAYD